MDQSSSEGGEKRRLPSRSTRGKRIADLEGVDRDVDEEFWKMSMFAEEEQDNEFETTEQILEEEQDYEDSDMDDYTSDEEGEEARAKTIEKKLAKEERGTRKRKNVYKDESKTTKKKKEQTKEETSPTSIEKPPKTTKTPKSSSSTVIIPPEMKRSSRQATVKATEATEVKLKAKTKQSKAKAPKEVKQLTQEELLEEAKITKEYNKASLQLLVQIEEDVRKKARESKSRNIDPNEPRVKYSSKNGTNLIEFINYGIPKYINQKMSEEEIKRFDIPKEEKQLKCVVTGLPAKYIDPLTHKPYANAEAFKVIREQFKSQHVK